MRQEAIAAVRKLESIPWYDSTVLVVFAIAGFFVFGITGITLRYPLAFVLASIVFTASGYVLWKEYRRHR